MQLINMISNLLIAVISTFIIFGIPYIIYIIIIFILRRNETEEEKKIREHKKLLKIKKRKEREKYLNLLFLFLFSQILIVFLISFFIVSIIKLNSSLAVKYIILCSTFICILIIIFLQKIYDSLVNIIYFLRNIYISVEMSRIEPKNKQPSREILLQDLEIENQDKIAKKLISKLCLGLFGKFILILHYSIYIFGTLFFTYILITNWDYINNISIDKIIFQIINRLDFH